MGERTVMAVELKAIKERWDIPDEERQKIIQKMTDVVNNSKSTRSRIMAARVLASFDQINVMDKKVGQAATPQQHIHVHAIAETNPKVIDAQANLVAALSEAAKQPHATNASAIVGDASDGI